MLDNKNEDLTNLKKFIAKVPKTITQNDKANIKVRFFSEGLIRCLQQLFWLPDCSCDIPAKKRLPEIWKIFDQNAKKKTKNRNSPIKK